MPCRGVEQRVARARHASLVCKRLRKRLNQEAELNRMHATNRLFPLGSLKQKNFNICLVGGPANSLGKVAFLPLPCANTFAWSWEIILNWMGSCPKKKLFDYDHCFKWLESESCSNPKPCRWTPWTPWTLFLWRTAVTPLIFWMFPTHAII
jgi:hypothetical protein